MAGSFTRQSGRTLLSHPECRSLSSTIAKHVAMKLNFTLKYNADPPFRPAPNQDLQFGPLDTTLEAVVAVTFL